MTGRPRADPCITGKRANLHFGGGTLSKQEVTPSYPADSLEAEAEHRAQVEAAFKETAGMWSNRDDMLSVDDYIRKIRKGRSFDI